MNQGMCDQTSAMAMVVSILVVIWDKEEHVQQHLLHTRHDVGCYQS